jgi:hypothetical protein
MLFAIVWSTYGRPAPRAGGRARTPSPPPRTCRCRCGAGAECRSGWWEMETIRVDDQSVNVNFASKGQPDLNLASQHLQVGCSCGVLVGEALHRRSIARVEIGSIKKIDFAFVRIVGSLPTHRPIRSAHPKVFGVSSWSATGRSRPLAPGSGTVLHSLPSAFGSMEVHSSMMM